MSYIQADLLHLRPRLDRVRTKGQLIPEEIFLDFKSPKTKRKILTDLCPSL
jgi:hypothetical protein